MAGSITSVIPTPNSVYSAPFSKSFAGSLGADVDAIALGGAPCRRVRCGGVGNLQVVYADGTIDTIPSVTAGEHLLVIVSKILMAGTTATNITLFW